MCAAVDCRKTTNEKRFGQRRSIDTAFLARFPADRFRTSHSNVLCNSCYMSLVRSLPSPTSPAPSFDGLNSLLQAMDEDSSPSPLLFSSSLASPSPSSTLTSVTSPSTFVPSPTPSTTSTVSSFNIHVPDLPIAARRSLSAVINAVVTIPPERRDRRELSFGTKRRRVEAFDAANELPFQERVAKRRELLTEWEVLHKDVAAWRVQMAGNDSLPKGGGRATRRPMTAIRAGGAGHKFALLPKEEQELDAWVQERRDKRWRVTVLSIQREARERFGIVASNKWAQGFMDRWRWSVRRITTNKEVTTERMQGFKFHWQNQNIDRLRGLPPSLVFNMDETCVYLDMPADYTVARKGSPTVEIASTQHDGHRVAVVICVDLKGGRVHALVLHKCRETKRLKKTNKFTQQTIHIKDAEGVEHDIVLWTTHNNSGWLNGPLMVKWLTKIYKPHALKEVKRLNRRARTTPPVPAVTSSSTDATDTTPPSIYSFEKDALLTMDNCGSHASAEVLASLRAEGINYLFFPPNCTPLLQPCDQNINQIFKKVYRERWEQWYYATGCQQFTEWGNEKKASEDEANEWIAYAIHAISQKVVLDSWGRSAFPQFTPMHLPQQAWELIVEYSAETASCVDLLRSVRAEYNKSATFVFPGKRKRKPKAQQVLTVEEIKARDEERKYAETVTTAAQAAQEVAQIMNSFMAGLPANTETERVRQTVQEAASGATEAARVFPLRPVHLR